MEPNPAPYNPFAWRFKPLREPMLWAAAAFSAGIVTARHAWRPDLWWFASAILFLLFATCLRRARVRAGVALVCAGLFFTGALYFQARQQPHLDTAILAFASGEPVSLIGHVIREGRVQPGSFGSLRQALDLEVESLPQDASPNPAILSTSSRAVIRLSLYGPAPMTIFRYGDRLQLVARLRPPRDFGNPGAFDYAAYLEDKGIVVLGSAKASSVALLLGHAGGRIGFWRARAHASIVEKVHQIFPERQAMLLDAMLIGDDAFIDRDTRTDFQRSGTYHALVVSGMNVSILAFAVFWMLRGLRCNDLSATLLTILFCCCYAFLTQVGAPVWRATLMNAIYLTTRLLYRKRSMTNALGAAALGILVFDPRQLFTASFQMTFLCVWIVSAIALPLLRRSSQRVRGALAFWDVADYGHYLHPRTAQLRLDLQSIALALSPFLGTWIARRLVRTLTLCAVAAFDLFVVATLMQAGLALPMAYYFHRAIALAVPANLAVVPLLGIMMPAAALAIALSYLSPMLAHPPAMAAGLALQGISGTVRDVGARPLADLRIPTPSYLMIALATIALLAAMLLIRRRPMLSAFGLFALLASSIALMLFPAFPVTRRGVLEMTSIDVGQGDATLLVMPGGQTLLIDAGGPIGGQASQLDFGEDVVSPYLWSRGISHLDAVAITHGHSDHIGGMKAVLANFRPRELWVGLLPPSEELDRLIREANSLGITVVRHWSGDSWDMGGANLEVLYPSRDTPVGPSPSNSDSTVLRVSYGHTAALLEGDADAFVESQVLRRYHPDAGLLKVAHHGSATSSIQPMLDAVHPHFAVISAGFRNPFGLPRTDVLQRLSHSGARVYRTDLSGAITFILDGDSISYRNP